MPLVAPYIKEANEKLNEEKDRINEIINKSLTDKNTIFVEGKYDKKYLELAIREFSKELTSLLDNQELVIYTKDGEGGCAAIVDFVKAWYYAKYDSKIYTIFDDDDEGRKYYQEIKEFFRDKKINNRRGKVNINFWSLTDDMKQMRKDRILFNLEVEHLLSSTIWSDIKEYSYFEDKDDNELSEILKNKLSRDKSIDNLLKELVSQNPQMEHILEYNPDHSKKGQIFNLVNNSKISKTELLGNFKPTIKELEKHFL